MSLYAIFVFLSASCPHRHRNKYKADIKSNDQFGIKGQRETEAVLTSVSYYQLGERSKTCDLMPPSFCAYRPGGEPRPRQTDACVSVLRHLAVILDGGAAGAIPFRAIADAVICIYTLRSRYLRHACSDGDSAWSRALSSVSMSSVCSHLRVCA